MYYILMCVFIVVATCQNRWVRLRDRFIKEKRLRETETRSDSGASHRSGFPLYNNIIFGKLCKTKKVNLINIKYNK